MPIQLKKELQSIGMKCFKIFIKSYDWTVNVLYDCSCSDNEQIINHLENIDCPIFLLEEAIDNLNTCRLNIGFTYSNYKRRLSVIMIGKTSSPGQFYNTIVHECYHLVSHITSRLDTNEEDRAILIGDVIEEFYEKFLKTEKFHQEL